MASGSDLRFHHLHGNNAVIMNGGRTALRQNCRSEFNDAIVISNRSVKGAGGAPPSPRRPSVPEAPAREESPSPWAAVGGLCISSGSPPAHFQE